MNKLGRHYLQPDWPVAKRVRAFTSTRRGGVSQPPFDSFNLATHVDDDSACVDENRRLLQSDLALDADPVWLQQVHGTQVQVNTDSAGCGVADAAYTDRSGQVCVVLTADCLPLFLAAADGSEVAVVHAGWRGLLAGVIEAAVKCFKNSPATIHAWLGPAIGPQRFEVGSEVRQAFISEAQSAGEALLPVENCFHAASRLDQDTPRWLADIYALARLRLARCGIHSTVGGGRFCTVSQADLFYSYRRDGKTGRMASLIWIGNDHE